MRIHGVACIYTLRLDVMWMCLGQTVSVLAFILLVNNIWVELGCRLHPILLAHHNDGMESTYECVFR